MTAFILKHFNLIKEVILKTNFLNYMNDEVLSQYDDKDILHSVIFYSKNMIFAKCNYEIYNKELLIIICCLKHWCSELKCTDILIKIFIDHLNLKYFMIIKELTWQQAKWAEKLSEYNFKIIYQLRKQNLKVNMLIRMSNVKSVEANNDWKLYQHQMLLSEDRFKLQSIKADQEDDQKADHDLIQILLKSDLKFDLNLKLESKANQNLIKEMISIQNQIIVKNQMNQLYFDIQIIMKQNRRTCQDIDLNNCKVLEHFFYFFIKCMQSMTMTLFRRCAYVKLHVSWSKLLLYIFSLINYIDSLRKQALSTKQLLSLVLLFSRLFMFFSLSTWWSILKRW